MYIQITGITPVSLSATQCLGCMKTIGNTLGFKKNVKINPDCINFLFKGQKVLHVAVLL